MNETQEETKLLVPAFENSAAKVGVNKHAPFDQRAQTQLKFNVTRPFAPQQIVKDQSAEGPEDLRSEQINQSQNFSRAQTQTQSHLYKTDASNLTDNHHPQLPVSKNRTQKADLQSKKRGSQSPENLSVPFSDAFFSTRNPIQQKQRNAQTQQHFAVTSCSQLRQQKRHQTILQQKRNSLLSQGSSTWRRNQDRSEVTTQTRAHSMGRIRAAGLNRDLQQEGSKFVRCRKTSTEMFSTGQKGKIMPNNSAAKEQQFKSKQNRNLNKSEQRALFNATLQKNQNEETKTVQLKTIDTFQKKPTTQNQLKREAERVLQNFQSLDQQLELNSRLEFPSNLNLNNYLRDLKDGKSNQKYYKDSQNLLKDQNYILKLRKFRDPTNLASHLLKRLDREGSQDGSNLKSEYSYLKRVLQREERPNSTTRPSTFQKFANPGNQSIRNNYIREGKFSREIYSQRPQTSPIKQASVNDQQSDSQMINRIRIRRESVKNDIQNDYQDLRMALKNQPQTRNRPIWKQQKSVGEIYPKRGLILEKQRTQTAPIRKGKLTKVSIPSNLTRQTLSRRRKLGSQSPKMKISPRKDTEISTLNDRKSPEICNLTLQNTIQSRNPTIQNFSTQLPVHRDQNQEQFGVTNHLEESKGRQTQLTCSILNRQNLNESPQQNEVSVAIQNNSPLQLQNQREITQEPLQILLQTRQISGQNLNVVQQTTTVGVEEEKVPLSGSVIIETPPRQIESNRQTSLHQQSVVPISNRDSSQISIRNATQQQQRVIQNQLEVDLHGDSRYISENDQNEQVGPNTMSNDALGTSSRSRRSNENCEDLLRQLVETIQNFGSNNDHTAQQNLISQIERSMHQARQIVNNQNRQQLPVRNGMSAPNAAANISVEYLQRRGQSRDYQRSGNDDESPQAAGLPSRENVASTTSAAELQVHNNSKLVESSALQLSEQQKSSSLTRRCLSSRAILKQDDELVLPEKLNEDLQNLTARHQLPESTGSIQKAPRLKNLSLANDRQSSTNQKDAHYFPEIEIVSLQNSLLSDVMLLNDKKSQTTQHRASRQALSNNNSQNGNRAGANGLCKLQIRSLNTGNRQNQIGDGDKTNQGAMISDNRIQSGRSRRSSRFGGGVAASSGFATSDTSSSYSCCSQVQSQQQQQPQQTQNDQVVDSIMQQSLPPATGLPLTTSHHLTVEENNVESFASRNMWNVENSSAPQNDQAPQQQNEEQIATLLREEQKDQHRVGEDRVEEQDRDEAALEFAQILDDLFQVEEDSEPNLKQFETRLGAQDLQTEFFYCDPPLVLELDSELDESNQSSKKRQYFSMQIQRVQNTELEKQDILTDFKDDFFRDQAAQAEQDPYQQIMIYDFNPKNDIDEKLQRLIQNRNRTNQSSQILTIQRLQTLKQFGKAKSNFTKNKEDLGESKSSKPSEKVIINIDVPKIKDDYKDETSEEDEEQMSFDKKLLSKTYQPSINQRRVTEMKTKNDFGAWKQNMKRDTLSMQKLGLLNYKKIALQMLKLQSIPKSASKYDFIFFDKEQTIIDKVCFKDGQDLTQIKNQFDVQDTIERNFLNKWNKMEQLFSNKRIMQKLQTFENDTSMLFSPQKNQTTELQKFSSANIASVFNKTQPKRSMTNKLSQPTLGANLFKKNNNGPSSMVSMLTKRVSAMTEVRFQDQFEEGFAFAELILKENTSKSYFLNVNAGHWEYFDCLESFDIKKRIQELENQGLIEIAQELMQSAQNDILRQFQENQQKLDGQKYVSPDSYQIDETEKESQTSSYNISNSMNSATNGGQIQESEVILFSQKINKFLSEIKDSALDSGSISKRSSLITSLFHFQKTSILGSNYKCIKKMLGIVAKQANYLSIPAKNGDDFDESSFNNEEIENQRQIYQAVRGIRVRVTDQQIQLFRNRFTKKVHKGYFKILTSKSHSRRYQKLMNAENSRFNTLESLKGDQVCRLSTRNSAQSYIKSVPIHYYLFQSGGSTSMRSNLLQHQTNEPLLNQIWRRALIAADSIYSDQQMQKIIRQQEERHKLRTMSKANSTLNPGTISSQQQPLSTPSSHALQFRDFKLQAFRLDQADQSHQNSLQKMAQNLLIQVENASPSSEVSQVPQMSRKFKSIPKMGDFKISDSTLNGHIEQYEVSETASSDSEYAFYRQNAIKLDLDVLAGVKNFTKPLYVADKNQQIVTGQQEIKQRAFKSKHKLGVNKIQQQILLIDLFEMQSNFVPSLSEQSTVMIMEIYQPIRNNKVYLNQRSLNSTLLNKSIEKRRKTLKTDRTRSQRQSQNNQHSQRIKRQSMISRQHSSVTNAQRFGRSHSMRSSSQNLALFVDKMATEDVYSMSSIHTGSSMHFSENSQKIFDFDQLERQQEFIAQKETCLFFEKLKMQKLQNSQLQQFGFVNSFQQEVLYTNDDQHQNLFEQYVYNPFDLPNDFKRLKSKKTYKQMQKEDQYLKQVVKSVSRRPNPTPSYPYDITSDSESIEESPSQQTNSLKDTFDQLVKISNEDDSATIGKFRLESRYRILNLVNRATLTPQRSVSNITGSRKRRFESPSVSSTGKQELNPFLTKRKTFYEKSLSPLMTKENFKKSGEIAKKLMHFPYLQNYDDKKKSQTDSPNISLQRVLDRSQKNMRNMNPKQAVQSSQDKSIEIFTAKISDINRQDKEKSQESLVWSSDTNSNKFDSAKSQSVKNGGEDYDFGFSEKILQNKKSQIDSSKVSFCVLLKHNDPEITNLRDCFGGKINQFRPQSNFFDKAETFNETSNIVDQGQPNRSRQLRIRHKDDAKEYKKEQQLAQINNLMLNGGQEMFIARLLEDYVENLDMTVNKGKQTFLMVAVRQGQTQIVKYLILKGANVDLQDLEGNTALHYAFKFNCRESQGILIEYGANEQIKNRDEQMPWQLLWGQNETNNKGNKSSSQQLEKTQ